jgi:hypothetical protein
MILFLDFDGVITHKDVAAKRYPPPAVMTSGSWTATTCQSEWYDLDARCISVLNKLVDVTNAKVVISSAWRTFYTEAQLVKHMKDFGFTGEVIGMTPHKLSLYWRDEEINMWMLFNNYTDDYLVLDDEEHHLRNMNKNNFVYIKHGWERSGLTGARAKLELIRVLRKRGITWDHSF